MLSLCKARAQCLARSAGHLFSKVTLVGVLTLGAALSAHADVIQGLVVAIQDGDTLTVLDEGKTQHKIRLTGIDAPEKKQPFGQRSKESLSNLVYRREVLVDWHKLDRYGRVLGKVVLGNRDINLAQVEAGLAWHYVEYAREQTPPDRALYSQAEAHAREGHVGLWSEPVPTAPWAFRKSKREAAHLSY